MKTTRLLVPALLGGAVVVALSCGDPSPTGVDTRGLAPRADLVDWVLSDTLVQYVSTQATGLLPCSPLPYDSVTLTIDSLGGTIQVGPHTLSIPPGALGAPVAISAVAPSETVNRVTFQPDGLVFQQPASLTMSYANCDVSGGEGTPVRIAQITDALEILGYLESAADPPWVIGRLDHFSGYAVAW